MGAFLVRRSAGLLLVLFSVSLLTFLALHLVPGDPIRLMVGPYASQQEVEELRHELGLDRSLPVQYVHWMGRAITGDLGRSIQGNADVLELIIDRLPATLMLTAAALAITVAVALPTGISDRTLPPQDGGAGIEHSCPDPGLGADILAGTGPDSGVRRRIAVVSDVRIRVARGRRSVPCCTIWCCPRSRWRHTKRRG